MCLARRNGDKLAGVCAEINDASTAYSASTAPGGGAGGAGGAGRATGYSLDARDEEDVARVFDAIEEDHGGRAPSCVVHNIGANVRFGVADTSARVYRKVWEMAAFSAFLVGKEAAGRMAAASTAAAAEAESSSSSPPPPPPPPPQQQQQQSILFPGATASLRGGPGFGAFSGAMFAKRSLSQSLARELGPKYGIHVAHVVVDGAIDTPWVRENFPDMAAAAAAKDGLLRPDAVAENFLHLHRQPRDAWTQELDLRPYCEKW